MRGEVEIWDGDNLLHKEPNMLVDGAGDLLAEIMTVTPSLSGVEAASSILDASNYTIQAVSFGTGSEAFRHNAHRSDGSVRQADWVTYQNVVGQLGPVVFLYEASATHPFFGQHKLSYTPSAGLPIAPTPILTSLEENTSVSAVVGGVDVSSIFPGNGQLTNFLPSSIFSSVVQGTAFSGTDGLSAFAAATTLGCFMESSGVPYSHADAGFINAKSTNDDGSIGATAWDTRVPVYTKGSYFNSASSMDVSGFVNMVMSGSPGTTAGYAMSSGGSGLCVSGGHDPTNSGTVEYTVMISADDMATTNAYGGIYHFGLWSIDMKESLQNGNTPPFAFSVLNNPRKYKLFARKGLSTNLCYIQDKSTGSSAAKSGTKNYTDLTIKWRLHFL